MARTSAWHKAGAAALLAAAAAGCTEHLTTPARCPELCPSSSVQLADTLLATPVAFDTSVRGYVLVREASFLLASNFDSLKSVALMRFSTTIVPWSVGTSDSVIPGATDSVLLVLHVQQRDTAVKGLRVVLYLLPARFDTTFTYDSVAPYLTGVSLVDTLPVPDSLAKGVLTLRLPTTWLPASSDSGLVALALGIVADSQTALGIESGNLNTGTSSPILQYYVSGEPPKDTLKHTFSTQPSFATFVMSPEPGQPASGVLSVGGIPSARGTLRLDLPKLVMDSASVVRGTLILHTLRPVSGFAHDSFYVSAIPLLRDFGIKSVVYPDSTISGSVLLHQGDSGTVEIGITPILRFWGTTTGDSVPHTLELRIYPEGFVLGAADFAGSGPGAPQVRVTYVKRYAFGVP